MIIPHSEIHHLPITKLKQGQILSAETKGYKAEANILIYNSRPVWPQPKAILASRYQLYLTGTGN